MKGLPVRRLPVRPVPAGAVAEQLTLVRRRAQPTAVYIARLTATAVFAYLVALQLPGGSPHSVLAPLTALLVAQASLSHTIRSAAQRVLAVTAGVLAAVAVAAYVPFSWWVLGLLTAATLVLGIVLRLREEILEVPISAMLIFSSGAHAAATSRITETLVGAAAGLAAGLVMAPIRVQPAREAVGDLSRQMADLLAQMAEGLAEAPEPRRAAEWLDRTRALRGEIERVDDALAQAEESVRLNPRKLRAGNPAAGLRDGVDTLERAATDMRVLARSVADSARIDSEDSPVREAETRARLAAVIAELSAAVRAYGQLLEAEPVPGVLAEFAAEPITGVLEDHLEEAHRQQDELAGLLSTDPAEHPEGWQLRGEILAHVDRLRSELEPGHLPKLATRKRPWADRHRSERHRHRSEREQHGARPPVEAYREHATGPRRQPNRPALRMRARRTASRFRARRGRLSGAAVTGCRVTCYSGGPRHPRGGPCSTRRIMGAAFSRSSPHMHSAHQVAPASASEPARSAAAAGLAGLMAHMTRSNGPVAGPTMVVGVRASAGSAPRGLRPCGRPAPGGRWARRSCRTRPRWARPGRPRGPSGPR